MRMMEMIINKPKTTKNMMMMMKRKMLLNDSLPRLNCKDADLELNRPFAARGHKMSQNWRAKDCDKQPLGNAE